jgi:hypothetical protein
MPGLWKRYVRRHPSLNDIPGITRTAAGIPGDPLNTALIGTKAEVMTIMVASKWYPADPLTHRYSSNRSMSGYLPMPSTSCRTS